MGAEIVRKAAAATMIEDIEGILMLTLERDIRYVQNGLVRDCLSGCCDLGLRRRTHLDILHRTYIAYQL